MDDDDDDSYGKNCEHSSTQMTESREHGCGRNAGNKKVLTRNHIISFVI